MKLRPEIGLTFDDVLLVPKHSSIPSRSAVDPSTWLTPQIKLSIPVVSANMDTVTEAPMAIAIAQAGGIGILHRFMTIEKQAQMVEQVKRSESFVVENPITIRPTATLHEAKAYMEETRVGGLVVTDEAGHLMGILTERDMLFAPDLSKNVEDVMTDRGRLVCASANETLDDARIRLYEKRIEKLPLVDDDDRVVGLITARDIVKIQEHPHATKDVKGRLRVGVAVGVRQEDMQRADACIQAGADVLVVDVAHGHMQAVVEMVRRLKSAFPSVPVIAGNVATAQGVEDLARAGADAVKVGVGSGSICITRVVTGFGVPQLTAIMDCAEVAKKLGVQLVADGGIRNSGDITKALAAGANSVMLGSLLAGTDQAPGAPVIRNGRRFKIVRGMASVSANVTRKQVERGEEVNPEEWVEVVPEGVEAVVPYRGDVSEILNQMIGGLRSGMSYCGSETLDLLYENAEFIRITHAGREESGVHDVNVL